MRINVGQVYNFKELIASIVFPTEIVLRKCVYLKGSCLASLKKKQIQGCAFTLDVTPPPSSNPDPSLYFKRTLKYRGLRLLKRW